MSKGIDTVGPAASEPRERFLAKVGPLRIGLAVIVIALLPMALLVEAGNKSGWAVVPTYVAPGLVVFIFWILPFDMLMAKIFAEGGDTADPSRFHAVVKLDLALMAGMLAFWGPFFVKLFST